MIELLARDAHGYDKPLAEAYLPDCAVDERVDGQVLISHPHRQYIGGAKAVLDSVICFTPEVYL